MREALITIVFLIVAAVIGMALKPNEDQLKPLEPTASSGDAGHDPHHHAGHH
jgi:hypothetical protein